MAAHVPITERVFPGDADGPEDDWQQWPLPYTAELDDSPVPSLSESQKRILNAMRQRPFGCTEERLAELADISNDEVEAVIAKLAELSYAESIGELVVLGDAHPGVLLWRLATNDMSMTLRTHLRRKSLSQNATDNCHKLPVFCWKSFWSGTPPWELKLDEDAVAIAYDLLTDFDPCSHAWALNNLPLKALKTCREMRGLESGPVRVLLDAAIERRSVSE